MYIQFIRGKRGRMYGVFGYARKPMIVKVNSLPRCLGYFGVK
nr:MAG TPA: hypothetical protein [Caudoviricetes sp.]